MSAKLSGALVHDAGSAKVIAPTVAVLIADDVGTLQTLLGVVEISETTMLTMFSELIEPLL